MAEVICLKAYLARKIWGTKVAYILPYAQYVSLSDEVKELVERGDFECKNLGPQVFKGYNGNTPFDLILLLWL